MKTFKFEANTYSAIFSVDDVNKCVNLISKDEFDLERCVEEYLEAAEEEYRHFENELDVAMYWASGGHTDGLEEVEGN